VLRTGQQQQQLDIGLRQSPTARWRSRSTITARRRRLVHHRRRALIKDARARGLLTYLLALQSAGGGVCWRGCSAELGPRMNPTWSHPAPTPSLHALISRLKRRAAAVTSHYCVTCTREAIHCSLATLMAMLLIRSCCLL